MSRPLQGPYLKPDGKYGYYWANYIKEDLSVVAEFKPEFATKAEATQHWEKEIVFEQPIRAECLRHQQAGFTLVKAKEVHGLIPNMNLSSKRKYALNWAAKILVEMKGENYVINRLFLPSETTHVRKEIEKTTKSYLTLLECLRCLNSILKLLSQIKKIPSGFSPFYWYDLKKRYLEKKPEQKKECHPLNQKDKDKIAAFIESLLSSSQYRDKVIGAALKCTKEIKRFKVTFVEKIKVSSVLFPFLVLPRHPTESFQRKVDIASIYDVLAPLISNKSPDAFIFSLNETGNHSISKKMVRNLLQRLTSDCTCKSINFIDLKNC